MTQTSRARRSHTARELGERFNRSPRTIRRIIAEPRDEWLLRATQRHEQIRALRAEGMTMRAIAEQLGCSVGTVHYALQQPASESQQAG